MIHQTLLAFDFGLKSIGVAVGQTITNTASPLPAIKAYYGIPDWLKIYALITEWQPNKIIVGLPIQLDGSEYYLTIRTRIFANYISNHYGIPVNLHDERLTTVEARNTLFTRGGFRALKKGKIDSIAAVFILESCLSNLKH